jgi:hypothetical protein
MMWSQYQVSDAQDDTLSSQALMDSTWRMAGPYPPQQELNLPTLDSPCSQLVVTVMDLP